MGKLFGKNLDTSIENRKNFLIKNKIAVYDSIFQCDIIGSSDASIKNVIPSDLSEMFSKADIKEVFCNGATSYKYYKKYQRKSGLDGVKLPSTSPANARYSLDDLLKEWSKILDYL